jgi:transcriptional regulator with XRE-family HTH domain
VTPLELRITRKQAKMTQSAMAKLLGVSRVSYNRWEKSRYAIPADAVDVLKNAGIAIAQDYSPAVYAYRNARIIFKKDHARALRMAKVTLAEQGAADFTLDDMKQLAIEFTGVVPDDVRAQILEASRAGKEV